MNWAKYIHLRGLLHIIWIIIIHIHNTHGFGNLISAYHATQGDEHLATTKFTPITTNNDAIAITTENLKQNTTTNTNRSSKMISDSANICGSNQWGNSDESISNSSTDIYVAYNIQIHTVDTSPILSYINHTSDYKQVFNPSWIPPSENVPHAGLMIQVQNCSLTPGVCAYCNSTPGMVYTPCNAISGICQKATSPSDGIPYKLQLNTSIYPTILKDTNYNQNPSIFYWNNWYYLFVNTLSQNKKEPQVYFELYTTTDPRNKTTWQLKNSAFPKNNKITGPASLLPRNVSKTNSKHYLFFGGEGHISVTNSCFLTQWENIDYTPWLLPRATYFDCDGVESGPAPIKLKDGNYLMLYNGYRIYDERIRQRVDVIAKGEHEEMVPHGAKHYQIGWVILDGNNPSRILQRSDKPLLTATYDYEIGNAPYTCTQSSSVYAKAIVRVDINGNETHNGNEYFRVYFSAADTSVGTAVVSVSYANDMNNSKKWFEIAVIVSIGCAIFVVTMFLMLWCKGSKNSVLDLRDLTTEPQFLSIASAHISSMRDAEISGTNHHGASYVIGSLDRDRNGSMNSRHSIMSSKVNQKKKKIKYNKVYQNTTDNPNHIQVCNAECNHNHNHEDGLNASLTSNVTISSSGSCNSNSNSNSNISESASSYCLECNGKYHTHENEKEISKSDTMRLSQISFRINETLEKESPSNKYNTINTITIAGVNPKDTKFSFYKHSINGKNNFGEPFIQKY